MKTYYDLLKIPPKELTDEEREQLNRCKAIPPSVRAMVEARRSQLQATLIKEQLESQELWEFLNGIYVPEETYYA